MPEYTRHHGESSAQSEAYRLLRGRWRVRGRPTRSTPPSPRPNCASSAFSIFPPEPNMKEGEEEEEEEEWASFSSLLLRRLLFAVNANVE